MFSAVHFDYGLSLEVWKFPLVTCWLLKMFWIWDFYIKNDYPVNEWICEDSLYKGDENSDSYQSYF